MKPAPPPLTLDEISEASGVERRTLRSWVAEGLLSPPLKSGRGAVYPAGNLERALAVRALQEVHGLQLSEIRLRLLTADEERIRGWSREAGRSRLSSARDYLRDLQAPAAPGPQRAGPQRAPRAQSPPEPPGTPQRMPPPDPPPKPGDLGGIEALAAALETFVRSPTGRRARAGTWLRVPITPDIELLVRDEMSAADRATLERIADLMRTILTGGVTDERF